MDLYLRKLLLVSLTVLVHKYPEFKDYVKTRINDPVKYKKYSKAANTCLVTTCLDFIYAEIFVGPNRYAKDG